jgi:hypothetical protein
MGGNEAFQPAQRSLAGVRIDACSVSGTTITSTCTPWLEQHPHLPGSEDCTPGIMHIDHRPGKTSTLFSKLSTSRRAKQRPLSESLGPPGPQTCHSTSSRISSLDQTSISLHPIFPVFEFPDELILSVLSYVSPDPRPNGQYARFRFPYYVRPNNYHRQRVAFLLLLSMTCRAMRLRLLPWIWERIEVFSVDWCGEGGLVWRPKVIVGALRADPGLTASVKYFHPHICHGSGLICIL